MMPWSESKKFNFIKGALRKATTRWPAKYEVLNAAKVGKRINPKSGRLAEHYRCVSCGQDSVSSSVCVDHIHPVVPIEGFTSWDVVIERMFCGPEGLQVLCSTCHKEKSQAENAARREYKKSKQ